MQCHVQCYAADNKVKDGTQKCRHGPIHVFQNIMIYDTFLRNIAIFTIFAIRRSEILGLFQLASVATSHVTLPSTKDDVPE